jgi:hypothetical protein
MGVQVGLPHSADTAAEIPTPPRQPLPPFPAPELLQWHIVQMEGAPNVFLGQHDVGHRRGSRRR